MADLGDITARLTADVGSFTAGMGSATTAVEHFQNAATTATAGNKTFYEGVAQAGEFAGGSERGIRRMEFALGSLAAHLTGVNHSLGTVVEGLLLFAGGSAVVLGVVGGLVAIVGAFEGVKLLTEQTRHETDKLATAFEKLVQGEFKQLHLELFEYKKQLADANADLRDLLPRAVGKHGIFDIDIEQQIADQRSKIATLTNIINLIEKELNQKIEHRSELDLAHKLAMDEFIARTTRQLDLEGETVATLLERQDVVEGLNTAYEKLLQLTQGDVGAAVFGSQRRAGAIGLEEIDKGVSAAVDQAQKILDKQLRDTERTTKEWGDRIARALVDGISGNLQSLGNLMKSIIEAWISTNIIQPFILSLGIFSPSSFGMYVGSMVAQGVALGMSTAPAIGPISLQMNVNKSGNLSPWDVARDADWSRAMRETMLVAYQQGFRMPGQP